MVLDHDLYEKRYTYIFDRYLVAYSPSESVPDVWYQFSIEWIDNFLKPIKNPT